MPALTPLFQCVHARAPAVVHLLHLGPMHQRELGRKLLKSSGNITLVVDNLEKRGLVRREREREDRRFSAHRCADGG